MLTIGRGWAIYVGPIEDSRLHRHQAAQLAWGRHGVLCLEGAWGVFEARGHFLAAGVPHRLVTADPVRMVFLDPTIHSVSPKVRQPAAATAPIAMQPDILEDELGRWLRGAIRGGQRTVLSRIRALVASAACGAHPRRRVHAYLRGTPCGFADSAHLTRTFVSTFGVRPTPLRGAQIICTAQSKPPFTLHGLEFVDTIRHAGRQTATQRRGKA